MSGLGGMSDPHTTKPYKAPNDLQILAADAGREFLRQAITAQFWAYYNKFSGGEKPPRLLKEHSLAFDEIKETYEVVTQLARIAFATPEPKT